MDSILFAVFAFAAIVAIFGALATLYGEDSRAGFAPYRAGA
jgi:hypothetical protein